MRHRFPPSAAFTLVELLVVIGVVAVLAGLLLPVVNSVRARADRTTALSQMHQIATALAAYPADHNGKLPGPLYPGQIPIFDPNRDGRLVRILAPYLNIAVPATPQPVPLFIPPAYKHSVTTDFMANDPRTYVLNMLVPKAGGGTLNPWGSSVDASPGQPLSLALMPGQAWAFCDADQQNPRVIPAYWKVNTPPGKVHGTLRFAVRFDGSAGEIADSELAIPPS